MNGGEAKMAEHEVAEKVVKRDLNGFIDSLPFEMHIPYYNYCGPGTKLEKRLKNKDAGINSLDEGCKSHDLIYSTSKDTKVRAEADKELAKIAIGRLFDPKVSSGEGGAAFVTAMAMAYKTNEEPFFEANLFKMMNSIKGGEYALKELKRLEPRNLKNNRERYEALKRRIERSKLKRDDLSKEEALGLDVINKILVDLPLSHYNYCGSGDGLPSNFDEKMANNVKGINELDEACKSHAIAYKYIGDPIERAKVDLQMAKDAATIVRGGKHSKAEINEASLVGVAAAYKVAPPSQPSNEPFTDIVPEIGRALHSFKEIIEGMKVGDEQLRKF